MAKLLDLLKTKPLTLIVNLPEKSAEAAKVAAEAGADALVFSFDTFENYLAQKNTIEVILQNSAIPCGINLESAKGLKPAEIKKWISVGLDFVGMPFGHVHPQIEKEAKIAEVQILGNDYTIDELMNIKNKSKVILEAAVVRKIDLSRELNVGDLQNFITMATSTDIPIVIPTQKRIHFSEVSILSDTGIKGLELTAVVLGKTIKSMQKAIREFRLAVDDLGEE